MKIIDNLDLIFSDSREKLLTKIYGLSDNIKIVSRGMSQNTYIYINGHRINSVQLIEFGDISPDKHLTVKLTFVMPELDIELDT